ncbi:hypothetical protein EDD90_1015 [Streptomyces sp. Ag109_O5-1]|uniref:hypothetical protein n=1 Tax=Streptomyces sp. Ag109_O5-1 TaxID=1938851 RepID=UPI000FAF966E|nr:hypothetical protein [Streptomyces sp. Ag109_O5-1]RPE38142.1 hypothetical protein EDD90_1015 [Streptomyces sp. Ag109_O5-1]
MTTHEEPAAEAVQRKERFGALPERIRPEDMVETRPAIQHDPDRDAYDPDEFAVRYGL